MTIQRVTLALSSSSQVSLILIFCRFVDSNAKIGTHLGFAGCALTSRPTMEIFSLIPLDFHSTNDDVYDNLARHISALKNALNKLDIHIDEVKKRRPAATSPVKTTASGRRIRSAIRPSHSPHLLAHLQILVPSSCLQFFLIQLDSPPVKADGIHLHTKGR
jgi:hypothetical protein